MSCGMGHMCITMGIAEAIAITMMVTANIFAISPAFGRSNPAYCRIAAGLTAAIR